MEVIDSLRQREAEPLIGDRKIRVPAVHVVPGEPGLFAEILATLPAEAAGTVGPAQPRHPDPVAGRESIRCRPVTDDPADDLVTRDQRQFRMIEFTIEDVELGSADPAGGYTDQYLSRAWLRNGNFPRRKASGLLFQDHGAQTRSRPLQAAAGPARSASRSGGGEETGSGNSRMIS